MTIQNLALADVTAVVSVEGKTIEVKSSSAHALDGQVHLTGTMEVTGNTPHYQLEAELDHASAAATGSALFDEEELGPGIDRPADQFEIVRL